MSDTSKIVLLVLFFIFTYALGVLWDEKNKLEYRIGELEAKMAPGTQIPDHLEDVGMGWHDILIDLHTHMAVVDPHYRVLQVKEKFGALRVYFTSKSEHHKALQDLVNKAEDSSCGTCEYCGKPGEARSTRWIKTLCDECHENRSSAL